MYGQNPTRKQELSDGSVLWIQEVFPTIQGEGPYAGLPAVFIRVAGCNLKCHFCDTDFESSKWYPTIENLLQAVDQATAMITLDQRKLVVITGGEPFRQNILPLIGLLNDHGYYVQIETAGTLFLEGMNRYFKPRTRAWDQRNSIVCSPKTAKLNKDVVPLISAYKYIVTAGEYDKLDGLPSKSTQILGQDCRIARPWENDAFFDPEKQDIYLQACDVGDPERNKANLNQAAKLVMQFGYKLCVQMHKYAGVP